MSVRKSTAYRITLIFLSMVCLAGAGYIVYRTYFANPSAEKLLASARVRYAAGQAAEKAGKPADAELAFAETYILAENGLKAADAALKKGQPAEETNKLAREFFLLHARSTRDRAYAKAAAEQKPLTEALDTTLNERYRSYHLLPDGAERARCLFDLREAFKFNADDPELAKELLRFELAVVPIDWPAVARVCEVLVKQTPNDPRANYCLARAEFQKNGPRAIDKSSDQVEVAEKYLQVATAAKSPYWRTTWLKLQILRWHAEMAARGKAKNADEKMNVLRSALLDADGALAKAAAGHAFSSLSTFDADGLLGTPPFALEVLLTNPAKPPAVEDVKAVCDAAVAVGRKLAESEAKDFLPEAGAMIATVTQLAAPALARGTKGEWEAVNKSAREFYAAQPAAVGTSAVRVALLSADAAAAARRAGDTTAAKELQDKSLASLETGLKDAAEKKAVPAQIEHHEALLMVKWMGGAKPEEIEPHVVALRGFDVPRAKAVANLFDAHLSARRGRVERARQLYDAVLKDKSAPDFALRAHVGLAETAQLLNDPSAAVTHLQQLAEAYRRYNTLSLPERDHLDQRFGGADVVTALQVLATVSSGYQRMAREQQSNPGKPLPLQLRESIIKPAEELAKTLSVPADKDKPSPDRSARLAIAEFRLLTGDREKAEKMLTDLNADYPRSVDVLAARVNLLLRQKEPDPTARDKADDLIQRFNRENADVRAGKLFWASWLVRTGRGKEAAEYLRNPVQFPDQKDKGLERLLAGALFQAGQREEAVKLLNALPADPAIDLALLQAAGSRDNRDALLKTALGRHENNSAFQLYEAATLLADGKFENAAGKLLALTEVTAARKSAREMLERALTAFAGRDLKAATAYLDKLVTDAPEEPAVYAGYAAAALFNEEVGQPGDVWPAKKTMYAAVNRWEQLAIERPNKPGVSALEAGLKRMGYHQMAGNPIAARQEGVRLLGQYKDNVPLLMLLAELFLGEPDPQPDKAKEYLAAAYQQVPPDSVRLLALDAAVKERTKDAAGAAAVFERMTVLFPLDGVGYANRIRLASAAGKPDEAAKWAVKWAEKQPENDLAVLELIAQYCLTGAKPAAVREADSLLKKVTEREKKAIDAASPKVSNEDAVKRLAAARAIANRAASSAFVRGKALDEADARLKAALNDAPTDLATRMAAGDLAILKQDWDGAVKLYQSLFDEDNTNGVAANNLAWVLAVKKNQPAQALSLVEKARTRKGSDRPIGAERLRPEFLDTIGVVYAKVANKDKYGEMRDLFDAAARRYPADPRMQFWLAEAHAGLGETAKANERYRVVVQLCGKPIPGLPDDERKQLADQATAKLPKLNSPN